MAPTRSPDGGRDCTKRIAKPTNGGFDPQLPLQEDLDLALRLGQAADAVAVPEIVAWAREHSGRKTRNAVDHHRVTANIFETAARRLADPQLRRLAQRRRAGHLASAGKGLIRKRRFIAGGVLIGRALLARSGLAWS